jgi:hypothetical protein
MTKMKRRKEWKGNKNEEKGRPELIYFSTNLDKDVVRMPKYWQTRT